MTGVGDDRGWRDLEWTPDLIREFWDWHATRQGSPYFSKLMARPLTTMVRCLVPEGGAVLDFGCGPGFLADPLIAAGMAYAGTDQSQASLDGLADRMRGRAGFLGALPMADGRVAADDAGFAAILLFEAVEHMSDAHAAGVLRECARLLAPDGLLLITVPHREDIEAAKVFCPVSRLAFHPWQHQRSFTAESLVEAMGRCGFATVFCAAGDIGRLCHAPLRNPLNWSANYLVDRALRAVLERTARPGPRPARWLRRVFNGAGPNLFWVGRVRRTAD